MCEPIKHVEIILKNNIDLIQRLFLIYTHRPVLERGECGPNLILTLFHCIKTHLIID